MDLESTSFVESNF